MNRFSGFGHIRQAIEAIAFVFVEEKSKKHKEKSEKQDKIKTLISHMNPFGKQIAVSLKCNIKCEVVKNVL